MRGKSVVKQANDPASGILFPGGYGSKPNSEHPKSAKAQIAQNSVMSRRANKVSLVTKRG